MKKRVLIDARMVGGHGIGLYVEDLAKGFAQIPLSFEPSFLVSPNLSQHSAIRNFQTVTSEIGFLHPKEAVSLGKEIQAQRPDLYHTPSFSSLLRYPCNYVQTIHDLNHLHYGNFIQRGYYRTILLPSVKKAKILSTVSQTSKKEIMAWFAHYHLQKTISVIPNSIELEVPVEFPLLEKCSLKKSAYFFCVATKKKHKNLEMLLNAYSIAKKEKSELEPLVICTPTPFQPGVVPVSQLEGSSIAQLMAGAKAVLFPSLYEGFGRPPLEAALLGTTSVVLDIPVAREVLMNLDFPIYQASSNPETWAQTFLLLHSQSKPNVSESDRSKIAEKYSLKNQANLTQEMYLEAFKIN